MAGYSRVKPPRTRPNDNNGDLPVSSLYSRLSIQNSPHWPSVNLHSPGPSVRTLNQSDGGTYQDDISSLANFSSEDIDPSVRGSVLTANMLASPSSNRPSAPSGGFHGQYQHLPVSLEKPGESRGSGGSTQSRPTPSIRADKRPYQPGLPPLVLSSRESTIRSTVFQDDSSYPSVPSVSSLIDNVIEDLPRLSVSTDTVLVPPLQSTRNGEHSSESHQLVSTNDTTMLCHFCGLLIEGAFVGTLWTAGKFHLQCFRSTGGHEDHESIPQVTEVTKSLLRETQPGVTSAEQMVELWRYNANLVFKPGKAVDMDLLAENRSLIHAGKLLRQPDTGVGRSGWSELFVLLFDNYLVMTKTKEKGGIKKYNVTGRPIPLDLLTLSNFNDPPTQCRTGLPRGLGGNKGDSTQRNTPGLTPGVATDSRVMFPFTFVHTNLLGGLYTVYAESSQARTEWKEKLEEAIELRKVVQESNMAFEVEMLRSTTSCSVPFTTTDGRALVAVGCAEGVWIGFRYDSRSMRRVLHLKVVTQCGVLEDFGIFLVLADKSLFAYDIEELVSPSPQRANTTQTPQKLSGSNVLFCRAGSFNGRTFVIYMNKKGSDSEFCVLAPFVEKMIEKAKAPVFLSSGFGLRPPLSEWFRTYRDFLLPTEAHDPPELIVSIVLYLSLHDISSFQRTCLELCDVCSDTTLRYLVQMERSGVSDDLRPGLSYPERLLLLQRREEAWANLDFHNNVQVTVPFESTGIFDFTCGAFFLGTMLHSTSPRLTTGYSYTAIPSLTSTEDPKLEWRELSLGIQILDIGLAVHEHDLIAVLTAEPDNDSQIVRHRNLEIRLLSFSTGQPHHLAEQPIIFIASISLIPDHPNFWIEIVGDYLALQITFPLQRVASVDMFFLVRWKKGEAYSLRSSKRGAYAQFSFLTEDTLVIPNPLQNNLEIVRIVVDESNDDVPCLVPLCALYLPPLAEHASIIALGCRAKPNPTGSGSGPLLVPAPFNRPFRDTAAAAIVLFNLQIKDMNPHAAHFSRETRRFTFIVHRRALVAHIPRAQLASAPFRSVPGAVPTVVPWDAWGVRVTRWFESGPASIRRITTAGQRAVTMEDFTPSPIIVRDFNPHAVRAALARKNSRVLPNGNRQAVKIEEDVIPAGSMFREDVRSALPYIETVTQTRYGYGGVLIDEERILGLETSQGDKGVSSSFDVHILG